MGPTSGRSLRATNALVHKRPARGRSPTLAPAAAISRNHPRPAPLIRPLTPVPRRLRCPQRWLFHCCSSARRQVWAHPTTTARRPSRPGSVRAPGGLRGLQNRRGAVQAVPGGFDSHPLPFWAAQRSETEQEKETGEGRCASRPRSRRRRRARVIHMEENRYNVKVLLAHRPSAADIERAKQLPRDACPRRHCWWWHSLTFDWDLPVARGCTFLSAEKPPGWRESQTPCRRSDPESTLDHSELREPHLVEDGFDLDHWKSGAWKQVEGRDFILWLPCGYEGDKDDEVSALVTTHAGERYWGRFLTPAILERTIGADRQGYAGGRYYWESGVVVVRDLAEETLLAVIVDLIDRHQLSAALAAVNQDTGD